MNLKRKLALLAAPIAAVGALGIWAAPALAGSGSATPGSDSTTKAPAAEAGDVGPDLGPNVGPDVNLEQTGGLNVNDGPDVAGGN